MPKNEKVVFKLLKDILEVLEFVHQQNVIHRDIKPQNLMRRKDGKIVLIDFGAVKEISAFGQSSGTIAIGTPGYMPSEQQASRPDLSSDIYAVGIIGFQALTGLNPQQLPRDASTGELCCALFSECANINPDFAEILDTMVRFDYRQRYNNAADALEALGQLLNIYQVPIPVSNPTEKPSQTSTNDDSDLPVQPSLLARFLQTLRQFFGGSETNNPQLLATIPPSQPTSKSSSFEQPEGAVNLDSAFYVERPPNEAECYETIHKPAALIRIKAPRQMGKTSLLTRILHEAKKHGCQTAYLNFRSADEEFLTSLDKLLCWFCTSITNELNLPDKLTEYWQGILGPKDKCTNYFQRYLLSTINSPIVLGLDDIDQVFQHPKVAADFLALLRVWNDKSSNNESWKKLRLVIVHSKEVDIPLNINQSPFNVGLPIELPELNSSQIQDLVQRHQLNWTQEQIQQLMVMVGGHPYLVRRALYEVARGKMSLMQLLQTAPTEQGIYSDYLHRHLSNLQRNSNLIAAFKEVIAASHAVRIETDLALKLRSMGLIKFQGNDAIASCKLYRQYFGDRLG
ncbi:AAA-like domain-containing protein [Tolypothrix sp. VBCCA 56010]|uniref:AAA-like domain-containing protein n=1 Tax=Tolypothrix sp. VBCCA 56010 TaxID=3137731 RepID=UPI003D7E0CD2